MTNTLNSTSDKLLTKADSFLGDICDSISISFSLESLGGFLVIASTFSALSLSCVSVLSRALAYAAADSAPISAPD